MATSDTYTLIISEVGAPSPHASSHAAGGTDAVTVSVSQISAIAANTVVGNDTGASAVPTAIATTGTGSVVRATDPTLTLTNATALPLTTGVTGILPVANGGTGISSIAAGVATFLGTPTSANLNNAVTDQTGSGALVFATGPTLTNPTISGTPTFSSPLSEANGGTGLSALGSNVATFLATPSSSNLLAAVTGETGIGQLVFNDAPTLVDPTIDGTPTFNYPLSVANGGTGISSFGAGIATFLGTPSSASLQAALTTSTGSGLAVFATTPSLVNPLISNPVLSAPLSVSNGGTGVSSKARGQCYANFFTTPVTQLGVGSTFVQLNTGSALALSNATNITLGTANTLTLKNSGSETRFFKVNAHVSIDAGSGVSHRLAAKLYKGLTGSHLGIDATEARWLIDAGGGVTPPADFVLTWIVELAQNEEVSVYIADVTATTDIRIHFVKMVIDNLL